MTSQNPLHTEIDMNLHIFESIKLHIVAFVRAKDTDEARAKLTKKIAENSVSSEEKFGFRTTIPGEANFTIGWLNLSQNQAWYID